MATVNVDIKTEVKGLTDVQKLEKRIKALEANVTTLNKKLPTAANGIKQTGRAAATATGNIQRMGVAIRTTLGPVVGLYAAFNFLNRSLQVASQRQVDVAKLSNGLKKLGASASDFERLQRAADNFGNSTLFDQEDATQAFALLTSFQRIGVESYERVTKAASDLATITGQDLKSAQIQLAKALEDPTKRVTDLARSGTVFTDQQKEQIKVLQESGRLFEAQNLILKEIEKQYGGAAEAAGSAGLAGALDSLGEATRDFQEELANSTLLIDGATEAIKLLTDSVGVLSEDLKDLNTVFKAVKILAKEAGLGTISLRDGIKLVQDAAISSIPGLKQMLWFYEKIVAVSGKIVDGEAGQRNFGADYASQERALFEASGSWTPYKPRELPGTGAGSGSGKGKGRTSKDDLAAIAQLAYGPQIIAAAKANNLDPRLLAGLVQVESGFNASAVSSAGAAGLTQLMPGTAGDLGVTDRFDPVQNLMGGAKYLRQMIDMFGDVTAGLRAYNQGPGNQQRYPGGVVQEAVQYPGKVLSAAQGFGFGGQGIADMNVDAYEEMTKQLEKQLKVYKDLSQEFNRELQLRQLGNDLARDLQNIENGRLDDIAKINELTDESQKAELTSMANEVARLKTIEQVNSLTEGTLNQAQAFIDLASEEADLLAKKQAYIEDGINPALAEQYVEIDKQVEKQLEQLTLMEEMLQVALLGVEAESEKAKAIQAQIDKINQLKVAVDASGEARKGNAAAEPGKLQSYMDQLHTELNDTEGMIVSLAQTVEAEIGSAMSSAIIGLIDGTKTAQEAFSDMFKNIGKAFIDMATQMIAKALVMKALGILQGAIGGGPAGGGGGSFFPLGQGFSFEGGGYTGDGPRSGGLDGRGGYLAMVHPQETIVDHHGAMGRYSGAGSSGGGGSRTIRFESTVINNVEYVTTEQAMAMSRQAADDGAKRGAAGGHARSMSTLKNSRSQRSKIGMR